jgi:opacity protein-like surface antigen
VKTGWAFGDLLAYGTIGWAYSTAKFTDATGTSNKSIKGTAYGAGAEFALTRNAFLRVEYLRYDFGAQTYVTPLNSRTLSTNTNLLRAGASVHF